MFKHRGNFASEAMQNLGGEFFECSEEKEGEVPKWFQNMAPTKKCKHRGNFLQFFAKNLGSEFLSVAKKEGEAPKLWFQNMAPTKKCKHRGNFLQFFAKNLGGEFFERSEEKEGEAPYTNPTNSTCERGDAYSVAKSISELCAEAYSSIASQYLLLVTYAIKI